MTGAEILTELETNWAVPKGAITMVRTNSIAPGGNSALEVYVRSNWSGQVSGGSFLQAGVALWVQVDQLDSLNSAASLVLACLAKTRLSKQNIGL